MARVAGQLGDASTALVLASPLDERAEAACFDHLSGSERSPRNVLNVLFTRRPERRVENWDRHVGALPESFAILSSQEATAPLDGVAVETIGRPGDLTGIGVAITERVSEWALDERTTFCLHSVTALLQYASREQVYQFLHALCGRLADRGAIGHVHMNPEAHGERTVDTFKTLFDAVVEVDDDEVTVTTH